MLNFEINWNKKLALRGEGTAAAIHETIYAFAHGNFVSLDRGETGTNGPVPTLAALLSIQPYVDADSALSGYFDDGTGRLMWSVWRP